MPSLVLHNKISHSILFSHEPFHPLPLKVFRYTCFVHNFSPGVDKLSPWSHKCVFLRFTISQERYKCFSPSLNHYFVYADVTFNESTFYFQSHSHSTESPSHIADIPSIVNILVICDLPGVPCMPSVFLHHHFKFIFAAIILNNHRMTQLKCQLLCLPFHQMTFQLPSKKVFFFYM